MTPRKAPEDRLKLGRPITYRPEYVAQAKRLCELGFTDLELMEFFGVSKTTFNQWKKDYPDFLNSLQIGKSPCDDRVERTLFEQLIGYEYEEDHPVKMRRPDGQEYIEVIRVKKQRLPDVRGMQYWLKNRRKTVWRDTYHHTTNDYHGNEVPLKVVIGTPINSESDHAKNLHDAIKIITDIQKTNPKLAEILGQLSADQFFTWYQDNKSKIDKTTKTIEHSLV